MLQPGSSFVIAVILSALIVSRGSSATTLFEPPRLSAGELQKLIPKLRRGGYVIYLRHMSSDHSHEDKRPVNLNDCSSQRPLSQKGRQQASELGKAFRQLKLPIDKVISSPFCRCRDTARLAFGRFVISDSLYFAMGLTREGKEAKGKLVREMLATQPARGKNVVIVSHTANLQEAVGLWPNPEGVAYIFKPEANAQFNAIGKVNPETWSQVSY